MIYGKLNNTASKCQSSGGIITTKHRKGHPKMKITTIGIDLAKNVFQIHGVDERGKVAVRKQLKRAEMLKYFAKLEPCLIGMEACGSAVSIPPSRRLDADCLPLVHYWARKLAEYGQSSATKNILWSANVRATTAPKKLWSCHQARLKPRLTSRHPTNLWMAKKTLGWRGVNGCAESTKRFTSRLPPHQNRNDGASHFQTTTTPAHNPTDTWHVEFTAPNE